MQDLRDKIRVVSSDLNRAIADRLSKHSRADGYSRLVFIIVPTALIGFAQFANVATGEPYGIWQLIGMCASIVTLLGSGLIFFTDYRAVAELRIAHSAVEAAKEVNEYYQQSDQLFFKMERDLDRTVSLVHSMNTMRELVGIALSENESDETKLISKMLETSARRLRVAFGFETQDTWTVCIYKAVSEDSAQKDILRCIAHDRSIPCSIDDARVWPSGTGVAGVAYANNNEVVIADMLSPDLEGTYKLKPPLNRDVDTERYRAIACVPVKFLTDEKPWGVVVATSNKPNHFHRNNLGFHPLETLRSLAGMTIVSALAVKKNKYFS